MHKAIEAVTVGDLAIVEFEPNESHCRFIRSTPMLTALAKEYSTLLPELGDGRGADIKPQLARLVPEAPAGLGWLHEIKYDGYRMHARIDWSHRYRRTVEALGSLKVKSAYLDGELCALNADGVPVFSRLQAGNGRGQDGSARVLRHRPAFSERRARRSFHSANARSGYSVCSRRRFRAFATASTLQATDRGSEHRPASWAWGRHLQAGRSPTRN